MRVFNVNKAVGLASSGVEYAQLYRRELFAEIPWVEDYYVFTDYMGTHISYFSDRIGIPRHQVLWIYNLVSGRPTLPSTVLLADYIATIAQPLIDRQTFRHHTDIVLADPAVRLRIRTLSGGIVDRVETLVGEQLVRMEHYDETLHNVEHFEGGALARRVFYTPDGRIAAEQFYRDGEISRTVITPASPLYRTPTRPGRSRPSSFTGDVILEGRSAFFRFVFEGLFDREDDIVIVDRALDVIDSIYPMIGPRRLFSIVHAEHFDLKQIEDGVLLWNNHYENVFSHPDLVDVFVVSTHRQEEVLRQQLASRLPADGFRVARIPVGFVDVRETPPTYDPVALVTASRLADEKHLDLLIRAVAEARSRVPGLRLDIYGEGDREPLLAAIEETGTRDCVRLMGHQKLEGVLGTYALYLSASTSEGFGLSLLEAIAECLPIVGFDVDYGNREMVEPGVNGLLVPHTSEEADVRALADAVVEVLTSGSLDALRERSLRRAQAYTSAHVRELWEQLLGEDERC
ncbi:glycosyltransferase [Microbacterium stercoris]|uniref:Glycosyltransferase n=1 Tax=Microbacterium stercoris TaxID=2820289 RepID=A0A939QG99_9MICO|nr:glycosyltransferase [Microbacterium stercoris]MBO3662208.1 glycosyltransferase [Microbacterium stercoris]